MLSGGRPREVRGVVFEILAEMLIRLPRGADAAVHALALIGIDGIIVRPPTDMEVAADIQPTEQLHVAERAEGMPRTKPLPGPRFVAVRVVDVEEALAREVESH